MNQLFVTCYSVVVNDVYPDIQDGNGLVPKAVSGSIEALDL